MKEKPVIIVVTPIRNEAWVLDAFLTCASSWADHIFLADQHSTDGSREIAAKYEKVILVDNDAAEMNQALARRLLFQEVDKIIGDKIVFALDADEFLSDGFEQTAGWKRILESEPNELFCFKWLELYGDFGHALPKSIYMEWACHFDASMSIADAYWRCEQRAVHESRVPCLSTDEVSYVEISDISFVHLANLNLVRQKNKFDFYQVHTVADLKERKSAVSMFRKYNPPIEMKELEAEVVLRGSLSDKDAKGLVKIGDVGQHYIDEMLSVFRNDGVEKYLRLAIWDNPYLKAAGIHPKLPLKYRLLHRYLRKTKEASEKTAVRALDKILKRIC